MKHIVPVSGGKDSQVVLALILDRFPKEDIVVVHQNTGYDHPDTYAHLDYIAEKYGVLIQHTHSKKYKDVFDLVEKTGYFPSSVARSCTSRLKQIPFGEWLVDNGYTEPGACMVYMGMRADESVKRATKYGELGNDEVFTLPELSSEYSAKKFKYVRVSLPIVTWNTEQVFAFLEARGDTVNPLYGRGHHRVGCYPCLLARNAEWVAAASDPVGRVHIKRLLDIEERFVANRNPRKLIKIHPTRDVRGLYEKGKVPDDADDAQCGWCSI